MTLKLLRAASILAMTTCLVASGWASEPDAEAKDSPWDAITKRAEAAPKTGWNADRTALESRDRFKAYYKSLANPKPPPPVAPAPTKLANLGDTPAAPRFELTGKSWPAAPGQASVCLWDDDKTAAFSFSIDDNNARDVAFWTELSKRYGDLKITWNLITINLDNTFDKRYAWSAGSWDMWKSVIKQGNHIASHSVTHVGDPVITDGWPGPAWEAAESKRVLDEHLTGRTTTLFAYPGSALKEFNDSRTWRPEVVKYYASARGTSGNPINIANQTDYFDIRTTSNPAGILAPTDPHLAEFNITNIINPDAAGRFKKYYRGWATTFIHSVNGGADWGKAASSQAHIAVFDWVTANRDQIWIGHLDDVALYGQERDTATVETRESTPARIVLSLTSKLDPRTFNYPLCVKVNIPPSWSGELQAEQGAQPIAVTVIQHEGARFALVKARPDAGEIQLHPKTP